MTTHECQDMPEYVIVLWEAGGWHLDTVGEVGAISYTDIHYCPWCGEELEDLRGVFDREIDEDTSVSA